VLSDWFIFRILLSLYFPISYLFFFSLISIMSNMQAASTSLAGESTTVANPIVAPPAPVILVKMAFGDAVFEFSSPFSNDTVEQAVHIAKAVALASCDRNARVFRNGVLVFAQPLFVLDVPRAPESDFCLDVLLECPSAFDVDKGAWEICLEFFFGSAFVSIISSFPSHEVPWAGQQAKAMSMAVGNCTRFYVKPPPDYPM
jgi:hypothetical protein